ncbi:MAG: hypothetical protein FWD19_06330, partial [Defluviitaleaceae bacterium]|nr:hypothetical protein [Defluviitaleaceae bacterium]
MNKPRRARRFRLFFVSYVLTIFFALIFFCAFFYLHTKNQNEIFVPTVLEIPETQTIETHEKIETQTIETHEKIETHETFETPEPAPTPTPEPSPSPTPSPWEIFSPRALPETNPETFPRFSYTQKIDDDMNLFPINFEMPENYSRVAGVTTFRGNNFRNNPTWGNISVSQEKLEIIYEKRIGSLGKWTGVGWTGQPVIIRWDDDIRAMMNLHPHFREKSGLIEVIQGAMDGNIYFFELHTGEETRPPIRFGDVIKGSVTVDARGLPLLYVGQGDIVGTNRF